MSKEINLLGCDLKEHGLGGMLQSNSFGLDKLNYQTLQALSGEELKQKVLQHDMALLDGPVCLSADKIIHHRSVGSHFLNYIDLVLNRNGQLWGESVFFRVFVEILRTHIKSQDYQGSVMLLGDNPQTLPCIGVLAQFGFEDFVFLNLDDQAESAGVKEINKSGLLNINISTVNSQAFVQSQNEYSICLVLEDNYPKQTLEDMSYFHFLSSKSMVFDLSGCSNFLFKEVKALGVYCVEYQEIIQQWADLLVEKINSFSSEMQSS